MMEANAKSKLCPFKMSGAVVGEAHGYNCEGSGCMGWDWYATTYKNKETGSVVGNLNGLDKDKYEVMPQQGGCGMKPPEEICANMSY